MICEKCGNPVADNSKFCTVCGAAMMQEAPAVQSESFFCAAPDLSAPKAEQAAAEQTVTVFADAVPEMPEEEAPVVLAEEDFFSQSGAENASAPVPVMQVVPAKEQEIAPTIEATPACAPAEAAPAKEKKSHAGLIIAVAAAAVIVLGVLIAGLLTNWFRPAKKHGPMDEIKAVCEATFPEDCTNGTANVCLKFGGMKFDIPVQFDIDRENPEESAAIADINILGQSMTVGFYQSKVILSANGYVAAEEIGGEMPSLDIGAMKTKDGKYDTESYFRETLDEDEFEAIAEETDFDELDKALQELEDDFNDKAWLEEFCGYSREKEDDTVTYIFRPTPELSGEIMRIFSPAYKGEEPLEAADFELPLEEIRIVAVKGKLDRIGVDLEVEGQSMALEISFDNLGNTKVDRDALSDLLDEAEENLYW